MKLNVFIEKTGSIFETMAGMNLSLPWSNEKYSLLFGDIETEDVDIAFEVKNAQKEVFSVIAEMSEEKLKKYYKSIFRRYRRGWEELADTYCQTFSIIENYDRYEDLKEVIEKKGKEIEKTAGKDVMDLVKDYARTLEKAGKEKQNETETIDNTLTNQTSGSNVKTGSEKDTMNDTTNTTKSESAFDSGLQDVEKTQNGGSTTSTHDYSSVTDTSSSNYTNTNKATNTNENVLSFEDRVDTENNSGSETTTKTTDNSNETSFEERKDERNNENHIHGNIGVTTSTAMIMEYRELWKDNYFDYLFDDLCKELTLSIY